MNRMDTAFGRRPRRRLLRIEVVNALEESLKSEFPGMVVVAGELSCRLIELAFEPM